jgi:hypothetical protein
MEEEEAVVELMAAEAVEALLVRLTLELLLAHN